MRLTASLPLLAAMLMHPAFAQTAAQPLAAAPPAAERHVAEQHTVNLNGFELYYETLGEGEPLLLLHAGLATARMWDPYVEELAKDHRLIIPDLRGHGHSTNPDGELSFRKCAKDMLALMDDLGLERFKGIGASMGAMTLLHMSLMQPERVEAMVLVGAGPYIPAGCREKLRQYTPETYPEAGWAIMRQRHVRGDDQIRALLEFLTSLSNDYDDAAFTPPLLSTIKARTLIVHGDRDYCFPVSLATEMYGAIPDAYLMVVPNGDHVPITGRHAEPFVKTVRNFLEGTL